MHGTGMIFGCARVSTDGRSVAAQVSQLKAAGCEKVFREVVSGARIDRKQLCQALERLGIGDLLVVTGLGRSTRDLLNILAASVAKIAGFQSLSAARADTTTAQGRLMLTIWGGFAAFERELIRARTGGGRKLATARGVKMGRKPRLTDHQRREALQRRDAGEPTREIAHGFNVSHNTISRLVACPPPSNRIQDFRRRR